MLIPNQVNNYSIWFGGNRFIGMADVTLPNLTNLTDELKGAGLGGVTNFPVAAHYDDWTATFNFHVITKEGCELMRQDGLKIEARAGIQYLEPGLHKLEIGAWRFVMAIIPRGFDLGKLEVGTKETAAVEVGVTYIKGMLNGEEIFEKDKINLIDRVLGTDYASAIRSAIGI
jgi:P2 family phage contractile tail tube protein